MNIENRFNYVPQDIVSSIFDFVLHDSDIEELDKLRRVCKSWDRLTLDHYHHFPTFNLRQKGCQPTLSEERKQKIQAILWARFRPLENSLHSEEFYSSKTREYLLFKENKPFDIRKRLSELDLQIDEVRRQIDEVLKAIKWVEVKSTVFEKIKKQKEFIGENESFLNQVLRICEWQVRGQLGPMGITQDLFPTAESKEKFLSQVAFVKKKMKKEIDKKIGKALLPLTNREGILKKQKLDFKEEAAKEIEKFLQEMEAIKQNLEKSKLGEDWKSTSQVTPLSLDKDWTLELKYLAERGDFQMLARILLFKPVFNPKALTPYLVGSSLKIGGAFCFGLMVKMGYDLSLSLISSSLLSAALVSCKNLKFSDFIKSGIQYDIFPDQLLSTLVVHLPEPPSSMQKIRPTYFHPELKPFLIEHSITREELKKILLDLFCSLDPTFLQKENGILSSLSPEKRELIEEIFRKDCKEVKEKWKKPSFLKKMTSHLKIKKKP